MTLTDAQIDRYSRQIIVPRIGGRGQERLLAARMLLVGDARDIEAPHAYLLGAGVGTIVTDVDRTHGPFDLALVIIGTDATRKMANAAVENSEARALIIARLDLPGRITIAPNARSPLSFNEPFGSRSEAADFIAMLATVEAFKLLAGYAENPAPAIIEFDGYAASVRAHP
jgi:hypothetical protein